MTVKLRQSSFAGAIALAASVAIALSAIGILALLGRQTLDRHPASVP